MCSRRGGGLAACAVAACRSTFPGGGGGSPRTARSPRSTSRRSCPRSCPASSEEAPQLHLPSDSICRRTTASVAQREARDESCTAPWSAREMPLRMRVFATAIAPDVRVAGTTACTHCRTPSENREGVRGGRLLIGIAEVHIERTVDVSMPTSDACSLLHGRSPRPTTSPSLAREYGIHLARLVLRSEAAITTLMITTPGGRGECGLPGACLEDHLARPPTPLPHRVVLPARLTTSEERLLLCSSPDAYAHDFEGPRVAAWVEGRRARLGFFCSLPPACECYQSLPLAQSSSATRRVAPVLQQQQCATSQQLSTRARHATHGTCRCRSLAAACRGQGALCRRSQRTRVSIFIFNIFFSPL